MGPHKASDTSDYTLSRWPPSCSLGGASAHALQKVKVRQRVDSPCSWSLLSDSLTAFASVGTPFAEDTQSLLIVQCLHMRQQMSGQKDEWGYCCCLSFYKQLLVAFNRIFKEPGTPIYSLSMESLFVTSASLLPGSQKSQLSGTVPGIFMTAVCSQLRFSVWLQT